MPYKDPEAYREYMRRYRQRKPGRKPVDPDHLRTLAASKGSKVATPRGAGMLLDVEAGAGCASVAIEGKAVSLPAERVGLW